MWIATTEGFLSVVSHTGRPDSVIVRGRIREDVVQAAERYVRESLSYDISDAAARRNAVVLVKATPDADYQYRFEADRETFSKVVGAIASEIDYPNFKAEVAKRQDQRRASIYGRVWATLTDLAFMEGRLL